MSVNEIRGCGNSHNLSNEQKNENQFQIKMNFKEIIQENKK